MIYQSYCHSLKCQLSRPWAEGERHIRLPLSQIVSLSLITRVRLQEIFAVTNFITKKVYLIPGVERPWERSSRHLFSFPCKVEMAEEQEYL